MTDRKFWRFFSFAEALAFAGFIALYIWRLQLTHVNSWMVFPIWLVVSFVAHRQTPKTLGWRADNLWEATRDAAIVLGACMAVVATVGLYLGALHRLPAHLMEPQRF